MIDFLFLHPEIVLFVTLIGLVINEITYHGESRRLTFITTWIGLGSAFLQVILSYRASAETMFSGAMTSDGLSTLFKLFFLASALLSTALSHYAKDHTESRKSEYCIFVVSAALAMCLTVSSNHVLLLFLSLQAVNAVAYFMSSHSKIGELSTEAGVKFLIFSIVASFFFLLGSAILFTHTHSLNFYDMNAVLIQNPLPYRLGLVVFVLYLVSFCFQVGTFPMYLWMPDVLEGAPLPSSLFLALCVPATGFATLLRLFGSVFSGRGVKGGLEFLLGGVDWALIVALLSGVTMVLGGLLSLKQKSAKRLIACLWVSHMGFLFMCFLVLEKTGAAALTYNLIVDLFCLVGLYSALLILSEPSGSDSLEDLANAAQRSGGQLIPERVALLVFLSCFIGFPPFPGFIGRFSMIESVASSQWYGLVVIAVLSSVMGAASFARLAFYLVGGMSRSNIVLREELPRRRPFLFALMVPLLLLSVFADRVLAWAAHSFKSIFW